MAVSLPRKKPTYYVHQNGFAMPYLFPPEDFLSALNYIPDPDDVFISTYPKCGTTWMQCIVHLLLNKGEPLQLGQSINNFIPHLEEVGKDVVAALPKPRLIKTHLPYDLCPKSSEAKYIYIVRNPKDCCVSFFHHTKGFAKYYHFEGGTFDDYFEIFLEGKVDFGDYFDNLLSWIAHRNDPNVLFLLYENMQSDVKSCIKKVGDFLGGPFCQSSNDPSILERIMENSSFKAMKSKSSCWSSEQVKGSAGFIRKGEVGNWRKYFSDEQNERMDKKIRDRLSGTEAEHLWDDYDI